MRPPLYDGQQAVWSAQRSVGARGVGGSTVYHRRNNHGLVVPDADSLQLGAQLLAPFLVMAKAGVLSNLFSPLRFMFYQAPRPWAGSLLSLALVLLLPAS